MQHNRLRSSEGAQPGSAVYGAERVSPIHHELYVRLVLGKMCLPAIIGDKWSDRKINKERLRVLTRSRRQASKSSLWKRVSGRGGRASQQERDYNVNCLFICKNILGEKEGKNVSEWTWLAQDRPEEDSVEDAGAQMAPEPPADTSGARNAAFLAFEARLIRCKLSLLWGFSKTLSFFL